MKILITGASGLVGSRFVEMYPSKTDLLTPGLSEFDITNLNSVQSYFSTNSIDVVINFAAYTNVSEAENQRGDKEGACWKINVEGTKNLIKVANPNIRFIQISTDMVFPGSKDNPGPYGEGQEVETDSVKVTWYGFCKGEAEKLVADGGTILRLIYPVRAKFAEKLDYLRKPLQLYNQGKLYPLFTDQQISIAFVDEVYTALQKIIELDAPGVFHASSSDTVTPYELITHLLQSMGKDISKIEKSSISGIANPVRYPQYGGLSVVETENKLGIKFSSWKEIVEKLIKQGITV